MLKKIAVGILVLIMTAGGYFLTMYAEADDAPGGVLIGIVVMVGAVGLGVMALRPTAGSGSG